MTSGKLTRRSPLGATVAVSGTLVFPMNAALFIPLGLCPDRSAEPSRKPVGTWVIETSSAPSRRLRQSRSAGEPLRHDLQGTLDGTVTISEWDR